MLKRDLLDAPWDSAFVTNNVNDVLQTVETMLNIYLINIFHSRARALKNQANQPG